MMDIKNKKRTAVAYWLMTGTGMIIVQIILGGITRLTGSGLSITEWKPIKGVIPPLNHEEWNAEFELYKQKVQYKTINEGMTLSEFKWIFFWEYFHRFWARFMGFVFIIPFAFFVWKKWFDKDLQKKIAVLFLWGGVFVGLYTLMMALVGSRFQGVDLVGIYAVMGLIWGVGALLGPALAGISMDLLPHGLPIFAASLRVLE